MDVIVLLMKIGVLLLVDVVYSCYIVLFVNDMLLMCGCVMLLECEVLLYEIGCLMNVVLGVIVVGFDCCGKIYLFYEDLLCWIEVGDMLVVI